MNSYKNNLITIACLFITSLLIVTQLIKAETLSSYELSQKASFNQVSHYPVAQTIDNSLISTDRKLGRTLNLARQAFI